MNFKPINLPADTNAHNNIAEWWYFNGHLKDKKGNRYSFMDCLFRADLDQVNLPFLRKIPFKKFASGFLPYVHFAHSVISDIGKQKNYKDIQNISLVSHDSFKRPLLFANYINPLLVLGYTNNEIAQTEAKSKSTPQTGTDKFHIKTDKMDLILESKKPVLLEQGKGIVDLCGRKSYLYSFTDLAAKGIIDLDGKIIEVEGKAWMDHQWANLPYKNDKWTWFSIQLENGTDMMIAEYDDNKKPNYFVNIIHRDGKTEHGSRAVFIPTANRRQIWKSKKTKAEYPLAWTLNIPDKKITINLEATMKDQEIIYGAINYWEGPMDVTAVINGEKIKGVGFMELLGFPSDYNFLLLTAKELEQSISKAIFRKKKTNST
jgi:predicted secreted hydrolase